MSTSLDVAPGAGAAGLVTIGEAAVLLGVTPRTLRYYEEIGLVCSSRSSVSSQRRYGPAELARLNQIRELQSLLGLDLEEIAEHLGAFDRLDALREEFRSAPEPVRRAEILREGMAILDRLQARVRERQDRLSQFAGELEERMERYRAAGRKQARAHKAK